MTVLVLGTTGQLAQHLRKVLRDACFWGRAECDLLDPTALTRAILTARPTAIVNAAAYTAVDRAESEPELAWQVNAEAPAAMARAAATLGVAIVQVSTDYVFSGVKVDGYAEADPVFPLNAYGRSKLGGELAVQTLCPRFWIVRTSWLFSEFGNNFVKTILRLSTEQDTLRVVDDQVGTPTYAGDLAAVICALLESAEQPAHLPSGVIHATGGPVVSWHGLAIEVLARALERQLIAKRPHVRAISTEDYPTAARRPRASVLLANARLPELGVTMDWKQGLDATLASLGRCHADQRPGVL